MLKTTIAIDGFLVTGRVSASQLEKFKNKKSYIKEYILGHRFQGNKYTRFGKEMHERLEKGDFKGEDLLDIVSLNIPETPNNEFEFKKEIDVNGRKITLHGFIDKYNPDLNELYDLKFVKVDGKVDNSFSAKDVLKNSQLDFYKAYHKIQTGRDIFKYGIINIHYYETQDGDLRLNGDITPIILSNTGDTNVVEELKNRLENFITGVESITDKEVEEIQKEMNTETVIDVGEDNETLLLDMSDLSAKIKELTEQLDSKRAIITTYLKTKKIDKLDRDYLAIYTTNKKSYTYPEEITKMEKELKDKQEDFKGKNEPTEITKSYSYRFL